MVADGRRFYLTQGVAGSFITASHLTRTRCAHQVTTASLHILQQKADQEYSSTVTVSDGPEVKSFDEWKEEMSNRFPLFLYWGHVFDLEICCLQVARDFFTFMRRSRLSLDVCPGPDQLRKAEIRRQYGTSRVYSPSLQLHCKPYHRYLKWSTVLG